MFLLYLCTQYTEEKKKHVKGFSKIVHRRSTVDRSREGSRHCFDPFSCAYMSPWAIKFCKKAISNNAGK